jgi:hypothetical protein
MRIRRSLFVLLTLSAGYVAVAGCGDEQAEPSADAGAPETSTVDSAPPTDAREDGRSPEYTGSACTAASDCYGDLLSEDGGSALKGDPVCLDKVTGGYCTHTCETDADCCAVEGECRTGLRQVCASFENTTEKYCFLSCEDPDITAANEAGATDAGQTGDGLDGDEYCRANTSDEFGCRSTGGGVENRKACLPIGAVDDAGDGVKKDSGADASDASDDGGDGDGE